MNPADLRAYANRWKAVAEVERQELAQMTPAQKFADLAKLMEVARALGDETPEDKEVEQVRRRWILLAERLGG